MAVPMVSFAKGFTFGGVQRCVASFRVAGVALCDIPTCFIERRFVWQGRYFCDVCRRCVAFNFSWQAQHSGDL